MERRMEHLLNISAGKATKTYSMFVALFYIGIAMVSCGEDETFCQADASFQTTETYPGWCTEESENNLTTQVFDIHGNLIEQATSSTGMVTYYFYDGASTLTGKEQWYEPEDELMLDTQISVTTYSYEYDSIEDHVSKIIEELDNDIDGVPDYRLTTYYNENGDVDASESDEGADGLELRIHRNYYNKNGNLERSETDLEGDGVVDIYVYIQYDFENGMVIVETDSDGNGSIDDISTSETIGNQTVVEFDEGADGTIERIFPLIF